MFTVTITFLDEIDEYGYISKDYYFEDVYDARKFYDMEKAYYINNGLVSICTDSY